MNVFLNEIICSTYFDINLLFFFYIYIAYRYNIYLTNYYFYDKELKKLIITQITCYLR